MEDPPRMRPEASSSAQNAACNPLSVETGTQHRSGLGVVREAPAASDKELPRNLLITNPLNPTGEMPWFYSRFIKRGGTADHVGEVAAAAIEDLISAAGVEGV